MTSSFHGESGRAEGLGVVVVWKWEREEQEYSSVWETQAWVCGWNVNEHGTGCEKWGCFAQWLQMCPFIMAPLLPFYSASVVVFFFFTWTLPHWCLLSLHIRGLLRCTDVSAVRSMSSLSLYAQPDLSNMLTPTWRECECGCPGGVHRTAHFGCEKLLFSCTLLH